MFDKFFNRVAGAVTITLAIPVVVAWLLSLSLGKQPWIWPAVAGFSVAIVIEASTVYFGRHRLRVFVRGYKWVAASYVFTLCANGKPSSYINQVEITIKAVRSGVRVFENAYNWTGSGPEQLPLVQSTEEGHTLLGAVQRGSIWGHYYVYLGSELKRGESTTVKLLQVFEDSDNRMTPVHTKTVLEPCKTITVITDFSHVPVQRNPRAFKIREWKTHGPNAPVLKSRAVELSSKQIMTETWKRPRLGRSYGHTWTWDALN